MGKTYFLLSSSSQSGGEGKPVNTHLPLGTMGAKQVWKALMKNIYQQSTKYMSTVAKGQTMILGTHFPLKALVLEEEVSASPTLLICWSGCREAPALRWKDHGPEQRLKDLSNQDFLPMQFCRLTSCFPLTFHQELGRVAWCSSTDLLTDSFPFLVHYAAESSLRNLLRAFHSLQGKV